MPVESALTLAPALEMKLGKKSPTKAEKIFRSMREKIREVFPDDDEEAWGWTGEDFEQHHIDAPEDDFKLWLAEQYEGSNEFTQRLVRRMFTIWDEMEREGFLANNRALYEHQKALFAWIAIKTANGIRDEIANLLVRSPYGSGKSLVSGLVVRAFREAQEELLAEGTPETEIPTGILLGLRKEHMLQNALGKQYAVLQPPYTVERQDIGVYWKSLGTMFGEDFTACFPRPSGKKHPFYDLFNTSEDIEDVRSADQRLDEYFSLMKDPQKKKWESISAKRRSDISETLARLIEGKVIFLPDIYNIPQQEKPLPRADESDAATGYKGDSAYALTETPTYRVKATHAHLALDRSAYTTQANLEHPAQFCIAYGSMVTRATENIRLDVREEIMERTGGMFIDEAGAYNPQSLGDSASELSGQWPYILGFTGQDRGIEGWTDRSPSLSLEKMRELGLMKAIAFQGIGDANNPPGQGTEEAWRAYRKQMFKEEKTAKTLHLPQPHELDSVVITPLAHVREYAHRILNAHDEQGIPVKVWCFDPAAGDNRWSMVVNGFNAPKNPGEPRRILVSPPSQMAEALHLHAECYDILANMNTYALDQTRGRLGHIRNDKTSPEKREKARTYFRVQWLEGASGEPYIREVAKMMGYALDEENAVWTPLHNMIDKAAYDEDDKRRGLSEAVQIPDAAAIAKRKRKKKGKTTTWTPLISTSPYVIERDRKREERLKGKGFAAASSAAQESKKPENGQGERQSPLSSQKTEPAPKAERKEFQAKKGSTSITMVADGDGWPMNLGDLADRFGVTQYMGSLTAGVADAYKKNLRGKQLAKAVLDKLISLQDSIERRSHQKHAKHADSGPHIEMKFGGRR